MERIATLLHPRDFDGLKYKGDEKEAQAVGLQRLWKEITTNQLLKGLTDTYRAIADKEQAKKFKSMQMPMVELHSVCNGGRKAGNVRDVTGWLCLDIDDYDGDYAELKQRLWEDPVLNPCLVFRSPSNKLKVVLQSGTTTTANFFSEYGSVMLWLWDNYGIKCDTSSNDIVRLCFLSHDPKALLDTTRITAAVGECDENQYAKVFGCGFGGGGAHGDDGSCDAIIACLARDGEGYPIYNRSARLRIGRRTNNSTETFVRTHEHGLKIGKIGDAQSLEEMGFGRIDGNELKYRINIAAMKLFNDNSEKAREFINTVFVDHGDVWSDCRYYGGGKYRVNKKVLKFLIRKCGFVLKPSNKVTKY